MIHTHHRSRRENFFLILTLGILNALTPFSIDMYLPSFPNIAKDLNVTVTQVALTISLYFVGYALGQIFYGPLLDRYGRKRPLYFSLALYIAASIGCMLSNSLDSLLFFRFLTALGGCAASVATLAMVRDFFPPQDATKIFSLLMLVLSVSPLLAPSIGSLIVSFASWRAIFAVLAGIGLADLLLVVFLLPEGHPPDHSVQLRPGPIFRNFMSILKNSQFATYNFAGALSFAGLFVYLAGSPAIFMDGFHVSAQAYGGIFAFLAVGMIGGGQLNLVLSRKFGEPKVFKSALVLQFIFGLLYLSGTWIDLFGLMTTIAILFLILTCAGISYPNAAALAMSPFSKNAGSASALMGFTQLGIGSLTSAGVGLLEMRGSLPTALVITISCSLALAVLLVASLPKKVADQASEVS